MAKNDQKWTIRNFRYGAKSGIISKFIFIYPFLSTYQLIQP